MCVCVPVCVLRGWHAWTQLNSGGNCRLSNSSCVDQLCLHVVCVQTEAVVWPSLRSLRSAYVAPQRPFILQPCVFPLPPLWSLFYFTWVIVASLKQMWFLTFNIIKQSTVKYLKLTTWGFFFSPNTPRLHLYSELSHRLCFSVFNYSASNWLKVSANQASSWGGPWPPSGNHAEPFFSACQRWWAHFKTLLDPFVRSVCKKSCRAGKESLTHTQTPPTYTPGGLSFIRVHFGSSERKLWSQTTAGKWPNSAVCVYFW